MEQALHGEGGYYAARVRNVGRTGDFSTSASVSSVLGEAVASWLDQELRIWPGVRSVIEIGGGDGSLSHAALDAIGWWTRRSLNWSMVETSPTLRAQLRTRLKSRVRWFDTLPDALAHCRGKRSSSTMNWSMPFQYGCCSGLRLSSHGKKSAWSGRHTAGQNALRQQK